jgi:hypothetical protein
MGEVWGARDIRLNRDVAIKTSCVTDGGRLRAAPVFLLPTHMAVLVVRSQYDVARDGRFRVNTELVSAATEPIHVLLN